jgi:hypothetical protein
VDKTKRESVSLSLETHFQVLHSRQIFTESATPCLDLFTDKVRFDRGIGAHRSGDFSLIRIHYALSGESRRFLLIEK